MATLCIHADDGANDNTVSIRTDADGAQVYVGQLSQINIGDRLGNTQRKLMLQNGYVFSTHDNDSIDALFKSSNANHFLSSVLHRIESHIGWVITALLVVLLTVFAFFKWGVPWASTQVAHALPEQANHFIADKTLEFLDEYFFEETQLSEEKTQAIKTHFFSQLVPLDDVEHSRKYQLHFRAWNQNGTSIPNAFALPSGDIILTDKFVELAQHQEEIDAVLLHEMGHVVHRHSLQMLIESTFVATVVVLATGDSSGLVDMGLGLGSLLVSSHYVREHELEADDYAFNQMLRAGINPIAFSNIMRRITDYTGNPEPADDEVLADNAEQETNVLIDYLSTHPSTQERIEKANKYIACYEKNLTVCL